MTGDVSFYHFVRMVEEYTGKFEDWEDSPYVQELRRVEKWEHEDLLFGLTLNFHIGQLLANWPSIRMVAINTQLSIREVLEMAYTIRKMHMTIWCADELNFSCYFELPG